MRCPDCGEFVRARVDQFCGTVEFFDLGLCTWGIDPAHGTSYELALVRNQRALEAAAPDAERQRAAYHVAGHVMAAALRHVPFAHVSLTAGLDLTLAVDWLTHPDVSPAQRTRRARRVIEVCLAGAVAVEILAPYGSAGSCAACVIDAGAWALARCADPASFRATARARLARRLPRYAQRMRAIATRLTAAGTLTAADVEALCGECTAHGR